jgi:hypothetical protein
MLATSNTNRERLLSHTRGMPVLFLLTATLPRFLRGLAVDERA